MNPLNDDQTYYKDTWILMLRHVLLWPDSHIHEWLNSRGLPLLTAKDSFVFHEEPWFWVCPEITKAFASQEQYAERDQDLEAAIWYVLADSLYDCKHPEKIDWPALRERCRTACDSA
ncbi:hypothetical protein HOV93_06010 [Planctomycetes bacterium FF15]|uniref:Uncharacterized protein n=1 Tax=Bremerella alba TaxID=980252 RepID=A0A7V9A5M9_9BACT|nr:hypothetical protein [Bremerella alba]